MPTKTILALVALCLMVGCDQQVKNYRLESSVMEPTFVRGSDLRVDENAFRRSRPQRWDVVMFRIPNDDTTLSAMRIVGLPGERVFIENEIVAIDGVALKPPAPLSLRYVPLKFMGARFATEEPFLVPPGCYFVLGDNTSNAKDSRFWGAVSADLIVGKVLTPTK